MFVLFVELIVGFETEGGVIEEQRAFGPFPSIIAAQIFERDELIDYIDNVMESIAGSNILTVYAPRLEAAFVYDSRATFD